MLPFSSYRILRVPNIGIDGRWCFSDGLYFPLTYLIGNVLTEVYGYAQSVA